MFDLVLDPLEVLVDEVQNLLTEFFLAAAVAVDRVDPVHVEQLRGDEPLKISGSIRLSNQIICIY
jgi:hypothetical protein